MTAQLRKKDNTQACTTHPDFLVRWLNGDLSKAELASLRNREEYEEMITTCNSGKTLAREKTNSPMTPSIPAKGNPTSDRAAKTNAFPIFVAMTIIAFATVLFFVKSSGWL